MNKTTGTVKKKRAGRSPGYPAIDIKMALKRATELYKEAQHHPSNVDVVAGHWGYKPGSSLALVTVAALKKYGLIIDEGSGKDRAVRLTELAFDIIKDTREDQGERNEKIRKAALKPKIHKEMYETYEEKLPSDKNLEFELDRKKGFTPNGAKDFISQYKRTLGFIINLGSDIIPFENDDKKLEVDRIKTPPPPPGGSVQTIQIPMLEGTWPSFTAEFPMTKEKWDYMMGVLKTMEPQLVKLESPEAEEAEEDEE